MNNFTAGDQPTNHCGGDSDTPSAVPEPPIAIYDFRLLVTVNPDGLTLSLQLNFFYIAFRFYLN
jgi:hypothetical protein